VPSAGHNAVAMDKEKGSFRLRR